MLYSPPPLNIYLSAASYEGLVDATLKDECVIVLGSLVKLPFKKIHSLQYISHTMRLSAISGFVSNNPVIARRVHMVSNLLNTLGIDDTESLGGIPHMLVWNSCLKYALKYGLVVDKDHTCPLKKYPPTPSLHAVYCPSCLQKNECTHYLYAMQELKNAP